MKLSDKLAKVGEDFTITKYDNGFKVEVRGETPDENWSTASILVTNLDQIFELLTEFDEMEQQ